MAIVFVALGIKMFVKKDGEFKKQCSTIDPNTGKNLGCTCAGAPGDGRCRNEDEEHNHKHTNISPNLAQIKELQSD